MVSWNLYRPVPCWSRTHIGQPVIFASMRFTWGQSVRGVASALVLASALLYATILPWAAAVGAGPRSAEAQLAADLGIICHPGAADASQSPSGQPPADDHSNCPLCKGLDAFDLAVPVTPGTALPPLRLVSLSFIPAHDTVSRAIAP